MRTKRERQQRYRASKKAKRSRRVGPNPMRGAQEQERIIREQEPPLDAEGEGVNHEQGNQSSLS